MVCRPTKSLKTTRFTKKSINYAWKKKHRESAILVWNGYFRVMFQASCNGEVCLILSMKLVWLGNMKFGGHRRSWVDPQKSLNLSHAQKVKGSLLFVFLVAIVHAICPVSQAAQRKLFLFIFIFLWASAPIITRNLVDMSNKSRLKKNKILRTWNGNFQLGVSFPGALQKIAITFSSSKLNLELPA